VGHQPARVLVLASEPRLIEDVRIALEPAHVDTQCTADKNRLAEVVAACRPHVVIADADLGQGEIVGDLKSIDPELALMALTRAKDVAAKLRPFQYGADDVLVVPFAAQELLARYTALLRRAQIGQNESGVLRADGLEINVLRRRATLRGTDLRLTPVEQSLLYLLATNAGRVLSRDQILDAVWGRRFATDSNLVDRHIRNLRTKLRDDWREPRFILTVNGRGYEFTGRTPSKPILEVSEQSVVQH
jgi:DNA-binding response OmpR family regulator